MQNFKAYTILYIEDDEEVRKINSRILKRMFKTLIEAKDGFEGFKLYKKYKPHIILTDINLPKLDGISLSKKIRENDLNTKIIISTAFSNKDYLLEAIELNLEKYIIKPLSSKNLYPALKKAVKKIEESKDKKIYLNANFYFDCKNLLFYYKDSPLTLTKKEFLFLELLVKNRNRTISYEEIERVVWNEKYMSIYSLRTTIGFLRKKLPIKCIKNISNIGYKLNIE